MVAHKFLIGTKERNSRKYKYPYPLASNEQLLYNNNKKVIGVMMTT